MMDLQGRQPHLSFNEQITLSVLAPGIWFKAANSQVVHGALVEVGVTILKAPFDGRFGRQFTFVDPDGYAITIYDRDEPADGWSQANSRRSILPRFIQ